MAIPFRRVRARQPQRDASIGWRNPITRGLVLAIDAGREIISKAQCGAVGTPSLKPAAFGRGMSGAAGTAYYSLPDSDRADQTGAITIIALVNGSSTNLTGAYLAKGAASTSNVPYFFGRAGNTSLLLTRGGASDWQQFGSGAPVVPNELCVVGVTQSGVLGAGATCNYFIAGKKTTVSGGGMANVVAAANAQVLRIAGTSEPQGITLLWNRVLSDTEIRSISANPWQIIAPRRKLLFVPATAGGSATATASFASVALTSVSGSATGNAVASGSLGALNISPQTGTASTGSGATASGAFATVNLSPASATASGSATATGGLATITLSPTTGTATGGAAGNTSASCSFAPISISPVVAVAIGSAMAQGSFQSIGITAATGSASGTSASGATASGSFAGITLTAATGAAISGTFTRAPAGQGPIALSAAGQRPEQLTAYRPSNSGGQRL